MKKYDRMLVSLQKLYTVAHEKKLFNTNIIKKCRRQSNKTKTIHTHKQRVNVWQ